MFLILLTVIGEQGSCEVERIVKIRKVSSFAIAPRGALDASSEPVAATTSNVRIASSSHLHASRIARPRSKHQHGSTRQELSVMQPKSNKVVSFCDDMAEKPPAAVLVHFRIDEGSWKSLFMKTYHEKLTRVVRSCRTEKGTRTLTMRKDHPSHQQSLCLVRR